MAGVYPCTRERRKAAAPAYGGLKGLPPYACCSRLTGLSGQKPPAAAVTCRNGLATRTRPSTMRPSPIGTGWPSALIGATPVALYARPQERSRPRLEQGSAAPKEQPPRKLSGKRTAGGRALWKAAAE